MDKRITDLNLIQLSDITPNDVLPIVDINTDETNKITIDQIKTYINSGVTNTFTTGFTYQDNTFTITDNSGTTFNANFTDVTGLTVNGDLNITGTTYSNTISATTYQNLPVTTDVFVTGGTYSAETITLTNNTGGTFSVSGITSETNLSKILFVDPNGNDSTALKGDLHKPYQNIYAAKSASTSGDTIYVFPGTWTYDNRNSAGNPYNFPNTETLFNLWKNGVNYYFSLGTKIIVFNQTQQSNLILFSPPTGSTYQTCNVDGYLEFESSSTGVDTFNGRAPFFGGISANFGTGFTFNAKVKSLKSYSAEIIIVETNIMESNPQKSYVSIVADEFYHEYLTGQSGSASGVFFSTNYPFNYSFNIKKYYNSFPGGAGYPFEIRNVTTSENNFNFKIEELVSNGSGFRFRNIGNTGTTEININRATINNSIVDGTTTNGMNITTKIDSLYNVGNNTTAIFNLAVPGSSKFDFKGNIFLNTTSTAGHPIVNSSSSTNFVNLDTNIYYSGSVNTTSNMISCTGGNINFKGNIYGQFAGRIITCTNGRVTLNGVSYFPSVTGGTILANSSVVTTGTTTIMNSLLFNNSSSSLINGQYSKINVLNSTIKNSGSGNLFVNTTITGALQIHNSTLQSVSGSTINITGGAPLTISNSTSNTNISAVTLDGSATILTNLEIL